MQVFLLVLNHNGRRRLAECLPSIMNAATASKYDCQVIVVDNESTDDSIAWLQANHPDVEILKRPNQGLASFNSVVAGLDGPVAILMNNDVMINAGCIDNLVRPLIEQRDPEELAVFMTAPLCRKFDGVTYEGFRTAVRWRFGLVQATALFPDHEKTMLEPGLTASAGAIMAIDCKRFMQVRGFDPLYMPGRIEDLDLCYRGFLAGYHVLYVPEAVAWHRGMATFRKVFGEAGCDRLALRNTLLFQWKNLRHPLHWIGHLLWLPVRLLYDLLRASWVPQARKLEFWRAFLGALRRVRLAMSSHYRFKGDWRREREFFKRFSFKRMGARSAPGT